jgi:hypothetical protein
MDPYIERPEIWPDFHDSLITFIRGALQPQLRPKYAALVQDRLYVVESERPIWPDVAVVRTGSPQPAKPHAAAVLDEIDTPLVFELWRQEVRQPLIQIVEPAAGNRIVTAIEVLSPDNKAEGPGRASYFRKREEFYNSGTNLVEIDLLRAGEPTLRVSARQVKQARPHQYLAAVTRHTPSRQEIYRIQLKHRLPRIGIPLSADDADVILDLQSVFTRCWDEGPYPELLRYDGPPPGTMSRSEIAWCEKLLRQAGLRANEPKSKREH